MWCSNCQEAGRELVLLKENLVDSVWGSDRPSPPKGSLRVHPVELAGESSTSKFARVREAMFEKGVDTLVTADVSEVAWMLNLRGQDELYTPIFISYLILTLREAILYVDTKKVTEEVQRQLEGCGCKVEPTEHILGGVGAYANVSTKIWMSGEQVWIVMLLCPLLQLGVCTLFVCLLCIT